MRTCCDMFEMLKQNELDRKWNDIGETGGGDGSYLMRFITH